MTLFTRRTGAWRVKLLAGWDAIEDLMGAALVSRQPLGEATRFRASINAVEVPAPLPDDLRAFADAQAALLTEGGAEPAELYALPAESPSRRPGVLAVGIAIRRHVPGLDVAVINEQAWADADQGSLVFTLMAEEGWYGKHREAMLSVPRSLELASEFDSK